MHIRRATLKNIDEIRDLYRNTILFINAQHYSPEQIGAWALTAEKVGSFEEKIREQHFFVAENIERITGFASIDNRGYLDFLYVDKGYQKQGIAKKLLDKIVETAKELMLENITSNVSITAKPFFENHRFKLIKEQTVLINGVELTNYKMEFELKEH